MRHIQRITFLLVFVILLLFNSCQKEDYTNLNIKLLVDKPVNTGTDAWTVKARILSSGKIELTNSGFHIMAGSSSQTVNTGERNEVGTVERIVVVSGGQTITSIVFFAEDGKGHTYQSEPQTEYVTAQAPVTISIPSQYWDGVGERFTANAFISDVSKYAIEQYGIEYRNAGSSGSWLTYVAMTSYFQTPIVPLDIQVPYNVYFTPYQNYEYRLFIKYYDLQQGTSLNVIYGDPYTFTASSAS